MNKAITKTQWMCVGLLIALSGGTPALADDTEILLINPTATNPPKPNVLLIFDTSGSMGDPVTTRVQYNAATTYSTTPAGCDPDRLYWSLVNTIPTCHGANAQFIEKSTFQCVSADARMAGIGSYSGPMVHYRDNGTGTPEWQAMGPGESGGLVECLADRATHGGGATAATDTFAQKGTSSVPYTADPGQEVDWTSNTISGAVTLYDGNYLNYRANPVMVNADKIDIVKDVATTVMNSVEDVNVGIMRFNITEGGPVIQDIVDLDTNRAAINAAIASLNTDGNGWTPLSETLYESALFWRGMDAQYGEAVDEFPTDPAALRQLDPEVYEQPVMSSCTKNFNVLLSDGLPTEDLGAPGLVGGMPNWSAALDGRVGCTGTNEGDCLDDIAEYLFKEDIDPILPGKQNVTTHTIGFDIDLPVLRATAENSGGEYFLASDVESLTLALLKIVSIVQDRSLSFTAPAVAVNSFNRTQNLNDLYLTTFGARGKVHWPGNVKKYEIRGGQIVDATGALAIDKISGFFKEDAQSFWSPGQDGFTVEEGGAASQLPAPGARNLYTYNGGNTDLFHASNAITTGNAGAYTLSDFGLTGAATEPTIYEIILWARGADQADEDNDNNLTEPRNQIGDPLHSQPAAVVYGGTAASPDTVIYSATNDGYLHAIDGATGVELWSFVPKEHLAAFSELYFNLDSRFKNYGIDGDVVPVIKDVNGDGVITKTDGDFVYIIFGMRRGGNSYYALDVTTKDKPELLWKFNHPMIGQSWSTPSVARVDMAAGSGQSTDQAVVVIGAGYDTAHDTISRTLTADGQGAGIFFLDLEYGTVLWRANANTTAELSLGAMTRGIPSGVRVIDLNGDGFADRMYASDLGGQLWRFDIHGGKAPNGLSTDALVTGGVIAQLGAEGNLPTTDAETRRFYNAPDVSLFTDHAQNRRFIALSIGSGYRAHPLDNTTNERFYSIRDKFVFSKMTQDQYNAITPVKESDLVEVSGTFGATIDASKAGWKFTLPPNQKVLTESATFNDELFFVSFSPDPDNVNSATCAAGVGRNFLYRVSISNGDPIADLTTLVPTDADSARVTALAQGGIAPSPRFLFPSPDSNCPPGDDCSQPPLGCVGVECFDPGFKNSPVRTLWTQDGIE